MELIVSNIAWTNEEESEVADKLVELGVKHVEIAPTKKWEDPTVVSADEARAYVDWWAERGITVSAFQSMLFARPDLKIFEDETNRAETLDYMKKFIGLAETMGAKRMVFGSPKNRQRGEMPVEQANEIAQAFFSELGGVAAKSGVVLCLEPNAPQYNCDYVTTAAEGAALVRAVSSPGFGLHLDTACMSLAGDDIPESIKANADILKHYHVSAPMLGEVDDTTDIDHAAAAQALKDVNYQGFVSIEMRPGDIGQNVGRVEAAVKFAREKYAI